jgi:general stress protein CsbA
VHFFAYKLQLALVAASRKAKYVHQFLVNLNFIINIFVASL